jgi:hypothetical protein
MAANERLDRRVHLIAPLRGAIGKFRREGPLRQSRAIKTAANEVSPEVSPLPNSLKSATLDVVKAGLWRMSAYIFRQKTPSRFLPRPYQQR